MHFLEQMPAVMKAQTPIVVNGSSLCAMPAAGSMSSTALLDLVRTRTVMLIMADKHQVDTGGRRASAMLDYGHLLTA